MVTQRQPPPFAKLESKSTYDPQMRKHTGSISRTLFDLKSYIRVVSVVLVVTCLLHSAAIICGFCMILRYSDEMRGARNARETIQKIERKLDMEFGR